jgi:pimeloyl-ACP methyl ester carboxylesterase
MFSACIVARSQAVRTFAPLGWRVFGLVLLAALIARGGPASAAEDAAEKIPPPEEVTVGTSDGLTLAATYYPSKAGKKAVPVILLHAWKGSRADFEDLALKLQRADHAVLAADLRGHGADRATALRNEDYVAMVFEDLEAIKKFLLVKNNAGELNIEKLCVVGAEMGSLVAVNWAAHDWSWPMLATGKQGQDVKALVLISPEWVFKGLRLHDAMAQANVRADLSVMIIAGGGNSKSLKEAKRVYGALERFHPTPPGEEAADTKQTLWLRTPSTSLQGTHLLNEKSLRVDQMILKFIDLRLVKQPIPWSERKNPRE